MSKESPESGIKPQIQQFEAEDLPEEVKEILSLVPKNKRELAQLKLSIAVTRVKTHSGPIPDPETLAQYDGILENGAERIMSMAERQSAHRISLEDFAIKEQIKQSGKGQWFAFILAILFLLGAIYCAFINQPTVAAIIGGGTIASLVGAFLYNKKSKRSDLDSKA